MTAGRPPMTLDQLPEGWQEKVLELAAQGCSDVEIRVNAFKGAKVGPKDNLKADPNYVMSNDLWYSLIDREEEFAETIKKAGELCHDWWLRHGRESLKDKDFSYTGWYMNMKNRFGWRDKAESTVDVTSKGEKVEGIAVSFVKPDDTENNPTSQA